LPKHHKRLTKRELKEDEVAEFVLGTAGYLRQHSKRILGIAIVAVIGALIVNVALRERKAAELEAESWVARANLEMKRGNPASALQSYLGAMDRFPGTWGYSDATFFAANMEFAMSNYDSSMAMFQRYLNLKKRRPEFTVSAELGVAQCLEETGRYGEAAETYLKVQREHADNPQAPEALFGAARCYELTDDLALAERTYNELIDLYPESSQASMAKMPLLEVQARLENS
jgi:tetratricopeptide (TPR) repeat protein